MNVYISASILTLAFLTFSCKKVTIDSIVEENLVVYENDYYPVDLNPNRRAFATQAEAFRLYGLKRYPEAQLMFENAFAQTADKELRFFNANVLMIQEKYDFALQVLDNVRINSRYYVQSQWLKTLVLIKLNDLERAENLLKAYVLLKSDYKMKEANQLLTLIQEQKVSQ